VVGRAAALLAVGGTLAVWYGVADRFDGVSLWRAVALIALVLIPATFALVALALPLWDAKGLLPVGIAFALLAFALTEAGLDVLANFAKLAAVVLVAWWFLSYFDQLTWVVLVACLIPWVDAYSVWRGPTKEITTNHENVFGAVSIGFVTPGGGSARLGLPDVLFFSLFLAAAVRFRLRVVWTWIGLTAGLALTIVLATWWDVDGLPALPGISLGFLIPNADLLWRRVRSRGAAGTQDGRPDSVTART
jgi:hypothetical protein